MSCLRYVKDDELVKFTGLSAASQEAGKYSREGFELFDWKRLEKWKYNERMPAEGHGKVSIAQ